MFRLRSGVAFARVVVFTQINDRDISAFPGERYRNGASDAAVAAGYERDFSTQMACCSILGSARCGRGCISAS
jgi:hypothetical protein